MLSKAKMVKIASKLYTGKCTIIEQEKFITENKSTSFREKIIVQDEPCRVSFSSKQTAKEGDSSVHYTSQEVKLFINPDIKINEGSKVIVTQNGDTYEYKQSGKIAKYTGHQEVMLISEDWV